MSLPQQAGCSDQSVPSVIKKTVMKKLHLILGLATAAAVIFVSFSEKINNEQISVHAGEINLLDSANISSAMDPAQRKIQCGIWRQTFPVRWQTHRS